jgi:hypothetical protein
MPEAPTEIGPALPITEGRDEGSGPAALEPTRLGVSIVWRAAHA